MKIKLQTLNKEVEVSFREENESDCYVIIGYDDHNDCNLVFCKSSDSVFEQFAKHCTAETFHEGTEDEYISLSWVRKNGDGFREYEEIYILGKKMV